VFSFLLFLSHSSDLHRTTPVLKELESDIQLLRRKHTDYPSATALRDRLKKEADYADYNRYTKLTELLWYVRADCELVMRVFIFFSMYEFFFLKKSSDFVKFPF
jgi:hypothetical protein